MDEEIFSYHAFINADHEEEYIMIKEEAKVTLETEDGRVVRSKIEVKVSRDPERVVAGLVKLITILATLLTYLVLKR